MRILICPDKFKESLTASQAADHIYAGIVKIMPEAECKKIPMADGGEGTVEALVSVTNGHILPIQVHDPLMRPITSFLGISGDGNTAFIEMASASGLALLKPEERDPLITTSFGTGELISAALDKGCSKILLGIGGSATVDGGAGMAKALGIEFTDVLGNEINPVGGNLNTINSIGFSKFDKRIKTCNISVACDVTNILTGPQGAASIFGPQKGANPTAVKILDENLLHLSRIIHHECQVDIGLLVGGGAAGGMGAGTVAFLGAELLKGFELIANGVQLEKWIRWADIVITGEGKMDFQTAFGKTPAGVGQITLQFGKPLIGFAGSFGEGYEKLYESGFNVLIPIADKPMTLEQCMTDAGELLENAAERMARILSVKTEQSCRLI